MGKHGTLSFFSIMLTMAMLYCLSNNMVVAENKNAEDALAKTMTTNTDKLIDRFNVPINLTKNDTDGNIVNRMIPDQLHGDLDLSKNALYREKTVVTDKPEKMSVWSTAISPSTPESIDEVNHKPGNAHHSRVNKTLTTDRSVKKLTDDYSVVPAHVTDNTTSELSIKPSKDPNVAVTGEENVTLSKIPAISVTVNAIDEHHLNPKVSGTDNDVSIIDHNSTTVAEEHAMGRPNVVDGKIDEFARHNLNVANYKKSTNINNGTDEIHNLHVSGDNELNKAPSKPPVMNIKYISYTQDSRISALNTTFGVRHINPSKDHNSKNVTGERDMGHTNVSSNIDESSRHNLNTLNDEKLIHANDSIDEILHLHVSGDGELNKAASKPPSQNMKYNLSTRNSKTFALNTTIGVRYGVNPPKASVDENVKSIIGHHGKNVAGEHNMGHTNVSANIDESSRHNLNASNDDKFINLTVDEMYNLHASGDGELKEAPSKPPIENVQYFSLTLDSNTSATKTSTKPIKLNDSEDDINLRLKGGDSVKKPSIALRDSFPSNAAPLGAVENMHILWTLENIRRTKNSSNMASVLHLQAADTYLINTLFNNINCTTNGVKSVSDVINGLSYYGKGSLYDDSMAGLLRLIDEAIEQWMGYSRYYNEVTGECDQNHIFECVQYKQIMYHNIDMYGCLTGNCEHNNYIACAFDPMATADKLMASNQPYKLGEACSECSHSSRCYNNLCARHCPPNDMDKCHCNLDCKNCANKDEENCHCFCLPGWTGKNCDNQSACVDVDQCGTVIKKESCGQITTRENCPKMCELCGTQFNSSSCPQFDQPKAGDEAINNTINMPDGPEPAHGVKDAASRQPLQTALYFVFGFIAWYIVG